MSPRHAFVVVAGVGLSLALSMAGTALNGPRFIAALAAGSTVAKDRAGGSGVTLAFRDSYGWLTRHPVLGGGRALSAQTRGAVASAVAAVPGIGGISWAQEGGPAAQAPHCQEDVNAILKSRTIRFTEASARIDPASDRLVDEVAKALRPCAGAIIAVTGHTDASGNPQVNKALSMARAEAVRWALVGRGIPAEGLRAAGLGAEKPIPGLDPADPANRRIEFSVIVAAPLRPTPIDTPGAG